MAVYLLLIWVGGNSGYITVDGIASLTECRALAERITVSPLGYDRLRYNFDCIQYQANTTQVPHDR